MKSRFAVASFALLACSCASVPEKAAPAEPQAAGQATARAVTCRSELSAKLSDADAKALDILKSEMRSRQVPGLQAAVVKKGEIILLQSCGIADVAFGAPVTRTTLFQIASATKPFTGVAVMQLVQDGKLNLDAPISTYLDGLPAEWRTLTLKQLLAHVSGLPDIIDPQTGKSLDSNEQAAWAKVTALPMQAKPGERFSYNQTNYLLIGRIIAKVTGKPFTDVIRERQFDVANIRSPPSPTPTTSCRARRQPTPTARSSMASGNVPTRSGLS